MPDETSPFLFEDNNMTNDDVDELLWELRSLGINAKRKNDLNDSKELNHLIDNIKLTLYQEYKIAYSRQELS